MDLDSLPAGATDRATRSVTILGSTGSVGCNTVELVESQRDAFAVEALTANRNAALLAEQAVRLGARMAVVADPSAYRDLKEALWGSGVEAAAGPAAVIEAADRPAEWVMASIVGAAGLEPTIASVRRGAVIALANKECLVSAGDVMVEEVTRCGARLIPVDSEHSAIFQVFDFDNADQVDSLILTASGGPFRAFDAAAMAAVTPAQAVAHPKWDMGAKISVDSATMMNKGLELIEAYHLFPVEKSSIRIVVHPQSVIHSLVSYVDGSVLAQLGVPDMRTPIAFALAWPRRMKTPAARLDLAEIATLTFEAPDEGRFPALRLAREALDIGGTAPTIMNAANEVAVHGFLAGDISFPFISTVVEETVEALPSRPLETLADVFEADATAREWARTLIANTSVRAVGTA